MKTIQYRGAKIRIIHGYVFRPGQTHQVEDDNIALDILTQPDEPFFEIETEPAQPAKSARRKAGKKE